MVSLSWAMFAGHPLGQSKHWHLACSSGNEVLKVGKNFGDPGCGPNTKFDLWKDLGLTRPWEPGAQVWGYSQEPRGLCQPPLPGGPSWLCLQQTPAEGVWPSPCGDTGSKASSPFMSGWGHHAWLPTPEIPGAALIFSRSLLVRPASVLLSPENPLRE